MKKVLLLSFLFITIYTIGQTQLGNDIQGVSVGDEFGISVSMSADGSKAAVGSRFNDLNGSNSGLVRVYEWNAGSSTWQQIGNDILGESTNDESGTSVSLSSDGSIVAIGAPFNGSNNEGHVRIYTYNTNNNTWEQLGNDIDGVSNGDQSGHAVSLSSDGSIVAIGGPFYDVDDGRVQVYSYNTNTSSWEQMGSDLSPSEAGGGRFGYSVSLSSNGLSLAIGAITGGTGGVNAGLVQIYTYNTNTEVWEQQGSTIFGESQSDESGFSVSLSSDGSIVAIGAPFNNGSGPSSGHVRVYNYNSNSGNWEQLGDDIDGEYSADDSGCSVSLSSNGTILAIGARANEENGNGGHVRIYQYNTVSEIWEHMGSDIEGDSSSFSGSSVSISSDGTIVAIGGPHLGGSTTNSGYVHIYNVESVLSADDRFIVETNFYPNPAKNELTIQLQEGIQLLEVDIYNQLGQLVSSSKETVIDVRNLSQGIYLVKILMDKGYSSKKLIIE